jgi:glycosyltransferase involved in cell wall biosynthesis
VAFPFTYRQRSVGGNISSANGVIKSFTLLDYYVDILSDDKVPGLKNDLKKIKFNFFNLQNFRFFFSKRCSIKFLDKIFIKLEYYFFRKVILKKLKNLLKKTKYEFIYVRASPYADVVSKLAKKYKVKLILEVNKPLSMGPYNKNNIINWPKNKTEVLVSDTEKIQYDIADVITVDSSLRAKWITDFVGDYKKKILINHNGVDTELFRPMKKNYLKLASLGFKSSDIIIGMASLFRWYNDLEELFEIIKLTIKKNNKIRYLLILGDRNKTNQMNNYIKQNNLMNYVKLHVEIPFNEMPEILNICDICVSHFNFHKKWPHNCSIKHMEYMASGKPVVATDVGEVNFAIENDINGFLCREGKVLDYVNAIDRLANNPNLRKKFGNAGRLKSETTLTWKSNLEKILFFFKKQN